MVGLSISLPAKWEQFLINLADDHDIDLNAVVSPRLREADPDKFGIFDMHGLRFVWGDVVRDFLALNKVEILPQDGGWGFLDQKLSDPLPNNETLILYDRIAAMTVEINGKFPELRAYYKNEPRFHTPSEGGSQK